MIPVETKFQIIQAALFAAHAAAAAVALYGNDWSVPVHVQYNKWTSAEARGCSPDTVCTLTEKRFVLKDPISLKITIAMFSIISGLHHLAAALFSDWYWNRCVLSGFNVLRVLDYSLSSPLMLLVNDILWTAPPELGKITVLVAAQCLVVICGAGSEYVWSIYFRDADGKHSEYWRAALGFFAVPLAIFSALWAVQWYVFGVALRDPGFRIDMLADTADVARPPGFVYAFLITLFATFLVFPIIHFVRIFRGDTTRLQDGKQQDRFVILNEAAYCFASFASKIPLLVLYRFGVSARSDSVVLMGPLDDITEVREAHADKSGTEPADAAVLAVTSVGISILLGIVSYFVLKRSLNTNKKGYEKMSTSHSWFFLFFDS
jgi:hypothetical protein